MFCFLGEKNKTRHKNVGKTATRHLSMSYRNFRRSGKAQTLATKTERHQPTTNNQTHKFAPENLCQEATRRERKLQKTDKGCRTKHTKTKMTKTDSISPFYTGPEENAKRTLSLMSRPRHSFPHFLSGPDFLGLRREVGGNMDGSVRKPHGPPSHVQTKMQNTIVIIKGRARIVALPCLNPRVTFTHALLTEKKQDREREREREGHKDKPKKQTDIDANNVVNPRKPQNSKEQSPAGREP